MRPGLPCSGAQVLPPFAALKTIKCFLGLILLSSFFVAESPVSQKLNSFKMETPSSRCHMDNFLEGKDFIVKCWGKSGTLSLATPQRVLIA